MPHFNKILTSCGEICKFGEIFIIKIKIEIFQGTFTTFKFGI